METFNENKKFGDIFCRYLKNKFDWSYEIVDPKSLKTPENYPDVDLILVSNNLPNLFLQLKQPLQFEKCEYVMARSHCKVFTRKPFNEMIKESESKYRKQGKNIGNIILILHFNSMIGYLLPDDGNFEPEIRSNFKGIYVVSPESILYGSSNQSIIEEFVKELKKIQ